MSRSAYRGLKLVLPLALLFLLLQLGCVTGERKTFGPGDLPPDFALEDTEGRRHALSDYRGKVVLLNFWARWCAPCVEEMPLLEKLYSQLKARGVVVLAVG